MSDVDEELEMFDDYICDALSAAKHGSYDGRSAEKHLERLLDKFRDPTDWLAAHDARVRAEALAPIEALAEEHERMVHPAPYTTERALIERLRAAMEAKG